MDLNGDGHLDILSGSWPGELFWFKGKGKSQFDAPIKLKDKNGKTINIGGGIRENSNGWLLIAGDADFKRTANGKQVIVYEGKEIPIPAGKQAGITGTASAVHAVDWDGDKDLDLIVGEIGGKVYLVPNEGTRTKPAFGKEQQLKSAGKPLRVDGDAGPYVTDWDKDGDLDLFVGSADGSVSLYLNTGTRKQPKLSDGKKIVSDGSNTYGPKAPTKPTRGTRSKVCVVDWNRDGKLDLLVGDYTTQKTVQPKMTAERKAELDKVREEIKKLQKPLSGLMRKLFPGPTFEKDEKKRKELNKEFQSLQKQMTKLRAQLPREYETHGWVWLFLRK